MSTPGPSLEQINVPGRGPLPNMSAASQLSVGSRHARERPRGSGWLRASWVDVLPHVGSPLRLVHSTWWAKTEVAEALPLIPLAAG